ncbi:hypothetical protein N431DRAFT_117580 [Stipitochalara longipes BDJ]|nr:hypothetical protein N431DRAFT_117580 [Stipitochalara longipes BDJ]
MPELQPAQPRKAIKLEPAPKTCPSFFLSANHDVYKTLSLSSCRIRSRLLPSHTTSRGIDIKYVALTNPQLVWAFSDVSQPQKYKATNDQRYAKRKCNMQACRTRSLSVQTLMYSARQNTSRFNSGQKNSSELLGDTRVSNRDSKANGNSDKGSLVNEYQPRMEV